MNQPLALCVLIPRAGPAGIHGETMSSGHRILVVEDDLLVSLVTTDSLEDLGCAIVGPATRLDAALELARSEQLDAAILDIDIAGEMVWPVAEELKRRGVPFVFLSAYCRLGGIPASLAGAPCLEKPLAPDRLSNLLNEIFER